MGSHQAVRRSQGWAHLPLLPPPSSLVSSHRGGGLGGLSQGWEDSEGTVCSELGASYIFVSTTSDPRKG